MRLLVARREVRYTGRLTAVLPEALRLPILKADGSVLVHDMLATPETSRCYPS